MIIGIVEVNERRYCCGVWNTQEHMKETVPVLEIETVAEIHLRVLGMGQTAVRGWIVTVDLDLLNERDQTWYGGEEYFHAYEYEEGNVPGFLGYDED